MHKGRPLVKALLIISRTAYYLSVMGPYLSRNNDASILKHVQLRGRLQLGGKWWYCWGWSGLETIWLARDLIPYAFLYVQRKGADDRKDCQYKSSCYRGGRESLISGECEREKERGEREHCLELNPIFYRLGDLWNPQTPGWSNGNTFGMYYQQVRFHQ